MEIIDTQGIISEIQKIMNETGLDIMLILNKEPGTAIQDKENKYLNLEVKGNDTFYMGYKLNPENGKLTLMSLSRIKGKEGVDTIKDIIQYKDIALEIIDNLISDYLAASHISHEKFAAKGSIHFVTNRQAFDALDNLAEAS